MPRLPQVSGGIDGELAVLSARLDAYLRRIQAIEREAGGPAATAYRDVAQSVATNTTTPITFTVIDHDTDGMIDLAANPAVLTVRTPGRYISIGHGRFPAGGTGLRSTAIFLNAATVLASLQLPPIGGAGPGAPLASRPYRLAAGDELSLSIFQDSGGTLSLPVDAGGLTLSAYWVGP